jgi:hypothetical protein
MLASVTLAPFSGWRTSNSWSATWPPSFSKGLEVFLLPEHPLRGGDSRADVADRLQVVVGPLAVEGDIGQRQLRRPGTLPGKDSAREQQVDEARDNSPGQAPIKERPAASAEVLGWVQYRAGGHAGGSRTRRTGWMHSTWVVPAAYVTRLVQRGVVPRIRKSNPKDGIIRDFADFRRCLLCEIRNMNNP